ncbi:tRNA pseudouridine(38-40) synthase TruA [Methanocella sp. CWC-04]|uniref:tRNA pseudouridine synthase A n=2 Tax=Methanooceanicella nereidis TaxID=2052831 RepID=A0AAP2RCQ9_9EURY|nr:tRNA pseudouridine(38-40) synthase TruA [Methanocella sp. CWC-04]
MKTAIKIAYIGTDFSGSQYQPDRRTVEGELKKGLVEAGTINENTRVYLSGRTDAGVHALCQVAAFEPADIKLAEPRIINSKMPKDLWSYSKAEVPDGFDPRRDPESREYRYILHAPGLDEVTMAMCSEMLLGTHDFTNFATLEPGKDPVRMVKNIGIRKHGDFFFIDIEANSFLWNMVRKIVSVLRMVGSGEQQPEWVEMLLDPGEHREGVPAAPAGGLYLMKINYPGIDFIDDEYAKKRAYRRLSESFESYYTMSEIYREFRDAMR